MTSNEHVIATADIGTELDLSKYLKGGVTVAQKVIRPGGLALVVESAGGSQYRLRAVDDDDDRLLMEKPDGDGWKPFIRLDAERSNPGPATTYAGP